VHEKAMQPSLRIVDVAIEALSGCGGSNRQLQSLSVSPASATAQGGQAQFTASGQFSAAPMSESPASVSWWQSPPVIDPPGSMIGLTLTNQPFMAQCSGFTGTTIIVTAVAPMKASASGDSMPLQVFADLVINHTTTQESGFVASISQ
jgi:hypothetical protein